MRTTCPTTVVARQAMATRFEVVLPGDNPVSLRAAAEEALDEIERLDAQLSLYQPSSEVRHINAHAAQRPIKVEPGLFRLLQQARGLWQETQGAFDITVGPLMRCWGFMGGQGCLPAPEELAEARAKVGMHLVELDEMGGTVFFKRPGVMLDLGSLGKGYALEKASEILLEAGITSGFLHGGTSSIYAIGAQPDGTPWRAALEKPQAARMGLEVRASPTAGTEYLAVIPLRNESLSVSAVWGKSFVSNGRVYGHVMHPRLGAPVAGALLSAVVLPSATETDAFTTALLTLGQGGCATLGPLRPGVRALAAGGGSDSYWLETINLEAAL